MDPFTAIDINSHSHDEMAPYYVRGDKFIFPIRYAEIYWKKLFLDNHIDSKKQGICPISKDGFLINEQKQKTNINVDMLKEVQAETFHIDKWYASVPPSVTIDCYLFPLSESERQLIVAKHLTHPELQPLIKKMEKLMSEHKDQKKWFFKLNSVSSKDTALTDVPSGSALPILQNLVQSTRTFTYLQSDKNAQIILRPWYDIPKKYEFRCFVHEKKLRAISQYECYTYYPDFQDKKLQKTLCDRIANFYQSIKDEGKFPYEDCVMDVLVWDDAPIPSFKDQNVFIIEFNQFGGETACGASLFNWEQHEMILYFSPIPVIKFKEHESELDKLARQLDQVGGNSPP